jgi:dimethylaniline monooxygenase (N-oxide forming)
MSSTQLALDESPSSHVIIIGAGWYGLAAAKTYLAINPSVSLTILEADSGIGGVWSRSRIYPRLVVNQPSPMFEYSDLSMAEALGLEDWSDVTGEMMAEYLEKYAAQFALLERCRFNTEVVKVEREEGTGLWKLLVRPTGQETGKRDVLKCVKLVMATGHTSKPKLPDNLDLSMFTGKVFHVKEIGQRCFDLLQDDDIKTVTVVGGNKSSFELAGMFALEGKKVNWLIKDEGTGPGMMLKDRPDGKKHAMQGMTARALSAVAPTPWQSERWITRFLYSGKHWLCRWFIVWFFKMAVKKPLEMYDKPNRRIMKPLTDRYVRTH